MRVNDQRDIIEQLLGITILSEKADALKEQTTSYQRCYHRRDSKD